MKQLGKLLGKNAKESNQNIRRMKENISLIHRTVDKVNPEQHFKLDFNLSDHQHQIAMDIIFEEADDECITEQIEQFASCLTRCPGFGPADGQTYEGQGQVFVSNIGGFTMAAEGRGVIVPVPGIYQIHFTNSVAGVASSNTIVWGSIRKNGAVLSEQAFQSPCDLCYWGPDFDLWSTVECAAGDNINSYMAASADYYFYTPSNFCGLFGVGGMAVTLVAQS